MGRTRTVSATLQALRGSACSITAAGPLFTASGRHEATTPHRHLQVPGYVPSRTPWDEGAELACGGIRRAASGRIPAAETSRDVAAHLPAGADVLRSQVSLRVLACIQPFPRTFRQPSFPALWKPSRERLGILLSVCSFWWLFASKLFDAIFSGVFCVRAGTD